jgi:hypothetical protein
MLQILTYINIDAQKKENYYDGDDAVYWIGHADLLAFIDFLLIWLLQYERWRVRNLLDWHLSIIKIRSIPKLNNQIDQQY